MTGVHCRTILQLEKELFDIKKSQLQGVLVQSHKEDPFSLTACISGEEGTKWKDGQFVVDLIFNENYNDEPPGVFFRTIPFHPNINIDTGAPQLDYLGSTSSWSGKRRTVKDVLLDLKSMLSHPNVRGCFDNAEDDSGAWNQSAADMLHQDQQKYEDRVSHCVQASIQLQGSSNMLLPKKNTEAEPIVETIKQDISNDNVIKKSTAKLSFEDYHSVWSTIATSQDASVLRKPNHLEEILEKVDSAFPKTSEGRHLSDVFGAVDTGQQPGLMTEVKKQLTEHNELMYGRFGKQEKRSKNFENLREKRTNLLNQLEQKSTDEETVITVPDSIYEDELQRHRSAASRSMLESAMEGRLLSSTVPRTAAAIESLLTLDMNDDITIDDHDLLNWASNLPD